MGDASYTEHAREALARSAPSGAPSRPGPLRGRRSLRAPARARSPPAPHRPRRALGGPGLPGRPRAARKPLLPYPWWIGRCWRRRGRRWSPSSSFPRRCWAPRRRSCWPPAPASGIAPAAAPTGRRAPPGSAASACPAPGGAGLRRAAPPRRRPRRRTPGREGSPAPAARSTRRSGAAPPAARRSCPPATAASSRAGAAWAPGRAAEGSGGWGKAGRDGKGERGRRLPPVRPLADFEGAERRWCGAHVAARRRYRGAGRDRGRKGLPLLLLLLLPMVLPPPVLGTPVLSLAALPCLRETPGIPPWRSAKPTRSLPPRRALRRTLIPLSTQKSLEISLPRCSPAPAVRNLQNSNSFHYNFLLLFTYLFIRSFIHVFVRVSSRHKVTQCEARGWNSFSAGRDEFKEKPRCQVLKFPSGLELQNGACLGVRFEPGDLQQLPKQAKGAFAPVQGSWRHLLFNGEECLASAQSSIHGEYKCAVQPALFVAPAGDLHKFHSECFFLHTSQTPTSNHTVNLPDEVPHQMKRSRKNYSFPKYPLGWIKTVSSKREREDSLVTKFWHGPSTSQLMAIYTDTK